MKKVRGECACPETHVERQKDIELRAPRLADCKKRRGKTRLKRPSLDKKRRGKRWSTRGQQGHLGHEKNAKKKKKTEGHLDQRGLPSGQTD